MSIWRKKEGPYLCVLFTRKDLSASPQEGAYWNEDKGPEDASKYGWGLIAPATLSRWRS